MAGLDWFIWAVMMWQVVVPDWHPTYDVSYNAFMPWEAQTIPTSAGNCHIQVHPDHWPFESEHAKQVIALHEVGHCLGIYRHLQQWSVMRGTDDLTHLTLNDVQAALALRGIELSNQAATSNPQLTVWLAPVWVSYPAYGSVGGGFYLDPASGQAWTAERGWHLFGPSSSPVPLAPS